jgi:predicted RNase H-like HicB family nuclease
MTPTEKLAVAVRALKFIATEDCGNPAGCGCCESDAEVANQALATLAAPSPEKAETTGEAVEEALGDIVSAAAEWLYIRRERNEPISIPEQVLATALDRLRALTARTGGGEK